MFLKKRNNISKIKRSNVKDYAALTTLYFYLLPLDLANLNACSSILDPHITHFPVILLYDLDLIGHRRLLAIVFI